MKRNYLSDFVDTSRKEEKQFAVGFGFCFAIALAIVTALIIL